MADLEGEPTEYWKRMDHAPCYLHKAKTLLSYAYKYLDLAKHENVMDLYTESAAARARIPQPLLEILEPKFRHVNDVPHQLGGPPTLVQDRRPPLLSVLLFQLGSDPGMGWMWGDVGGIYICIRPWNLMLRRFHKVFGWLEGH